VGATYTVKLPIPGLRAPPDWTKKEFPPPVLKKKRIRVLKAGSPQARGKNRFFFPTTDRNFVFFQTGKTKTNSFFPTGSPNQNQTPMEGGTRPKKQVGAPPSESTPTREKKPRFFFGDWKKEAQGRLPVKNG